jgi:hypothetical protein
VRCNIYIYVVRRQKVNYVHSRSGGMQWSSWLRHCATNWKVSGSIPIGVIGIFHGHTLGLSQPLTEMSTRNIVWGVKAAGVQG